MILGSGARLGNVDPELLLPYILQRLGTACGRRLGPELDRHAAEHGVQGGRIDETRKALHYRLGQQILARHALEGLGRKRSRTGTRRQFGAVERDLEQMLL